MYISFYDFQKLKVEYNRELLDILYLITMKNQTYEGQSQAEACLWSE